MLRVGDVSVRVIHTPGTPAGALRVRRGRAARPHGRLALHRRRRPTRPRGRRARRRGGALSLTAAPEGAPGRVRGVSRARRRLAVRRGDEPSDHSSTDRPREGHERRARATGTCRRSSPHRLRVDTASAYDRARRGAQQGRVRRRARSRSSTWTTSATRPSSTSAPRRHMRQDTSTARSTFPSPARRSRPAPDSSSIRTSESSSTRRRRRGGSEAAQGLRAVGFLELAGYVTQVDDDRATPSPSSSTSSRGWSSKAPCRCSTCGRSRSATRGTSPARCTSRFACCADSGLKAWTRTKPVVTICESGMRASIAASVLECRGRRRAAGAARRRARLARRNRVVQALRLYVSRSTT